MVKVNGPCFSLEASGSLGKAITFQKGLKSRMVRKCPKPKYTRTPDQILVRNMFALAIIYWHDLTPSQVALWNAFTDGEGNMGYHAFMHQWASRGLAGLNQYQLPPDIGYCLVGEHIVGDFTTGGALITS